MMIKTNLKVLMAKSDINMITLSEQIGVSRQAISKLANNQAKLYDSDVLEKLCKFFKCSVGDILEYHDDLEQKNIPA